MFILFSALGWNSDTELEDKVRLAAEDDKAFAELSREFTRHNRFIASRVTKRFITESDDEWSVVLLAFYEAVRSYEPSRGSFTAFSDMVIRRRLVDYIRSQARRAGETTVDMTASDLTSQENEDAAAPGMSAAAAGIINQSLSAAEQEEERRDIKWEIEGLNKVLSKYGIAFADLPDVSPKAEKTRYSCAAAINYVCGNKELRDKMKRTGRLPAGEISKNCGIPLKNLDNHRKYIIAVIEINDGDYPSLQQFTAGIRKKTPTGGYE